jgi:hypothetical protein
MYAKSIIPMRRKSRLKYFTLFFLMTFSVKKENILQIINASDIKV